MNPTAAERTPSYLENTRHHLKIAEELYPNIVKQCHMLLTQNPAMSEKKLFQLALQHLLGDRAEAINATIADDVNHKNLFDSGERFSQAKNALKAAGLESFSTQLTRENYAAFDIKQMRDVFAHPEQEHIARLDQSEYPTSTKAAHAEITGALHTLNTLSAADIKNQEAFERTKTLLQHMQASLAYFAKPDGQRITHAAELTMQDMRQAIHIHEIQAGGFAKCYLAALCDIDKLPPTVADALCTLRLRRNDLAHLNESAKRPGALARALSGNTLHPILSDSHPA